MDGDDFVVFLLMEDDGMLGPFLKMVKDYAALWSAAGVVYWWNPGGVIEKAPDV